MNIFNAFLNAYGLSRIRGIFSACLLCHEKCPSHKWEGAKEIRKAGKEIFICNK